MLLPLFTSNEQISLLPQKPEKWAKMMSQEENLVLLSEFLEKGDCRVLVVYANQQGQLTPSTSFPNTTKTKVVCACGGRLLCMCIYISWRASMFWGCVITSSLLCMIFIQSLNSLNSFGNYYAIIMSYIIICRQFL